MYLVLVSYKEVSHHFSYEGVFRLVTREYKVLSYKGRIVGYRLIAEDNSFVDIPRSTARQYYLSPYKNSGTLSVELYDEEGVKVFRTPHEKYGVTKGYIIPVGIDDYLGIQQYKWSRPNFMRAVKRISDTFSKSLSSEILDRSVYAFTDDVNEEFATYRFWFLRGDLYYTDEPLLGVRG